MNSPAEPEGTDITRPQVHNRDIDRGGGLGAIVAMVAVAAVIIATMLYMMQPAQAPNRVTSEAPGATSPAPTPKPNIAQ